MSSYRYDIVYLAERRHDVHGWQVSQFIFIASLLYIGQLLRFATRIMQMAVFEASGKPELTQGQKTSSETPRFLKIGRISRRQTKPTCAASE